MQPTAIFDQLQASFAGRVHALVADSLDPTILIDKNAVHDIAVTLKSDAALAFDFLASISGVDLGDKLQCVYHLYSYRHRQALVLKADVPYNDPALPSVVDVWPAANWLEREQYDLMGLRFTGHPDLRRIMLPEDWVGHPLRKDYQQQASYHGIDTHRPNPLELLAPPSATPTTTEAPNAN